MDTPAQPSQLIADLVRRVPLRANSAIITIFGDAVLPRGGNIWLGSLIALAAPLGIAERLVRTGVYRLGQEGWLTSQTRGRRAYYTLTEAGREKFHEAQRRIYATEPVAWDGEWRLVQALPAMAADQRQALKRELGWLGFGQISPTLFAHPTETTATIARTLARLALAEHALVFRAHMAEIVPEEARDAAVHEAWQLNDLKSEYDCFVATFAPLADALGRGRTLSDIDAFTLRILLIHEYRRLLLKDPVLPDPLLPEDWTGTIARDLAVDIYRRVAKAADQHLVAHLETLSGKVPNLSPLYRKRFGGLLA